MGAKNTKAAYHQNIVVQFIVQEKLLQSLEALLEEDFQNSFRFWYIRT